MLRNNDGDYFAEARNDGWGGCDGGMGGDDGGKKGLEWLGWEVGWCVEVGPLRFCYSRLVYLKAREQLFKQVNILLLFLRKGYIIYLKIIKVYLLKKQKGASLV